MFGKIIKKEPFTGKSKTKAGKTAKLGTRITNADGETKVLLNPSGKGAKFSAELKHNKRFTNSGTLKRDKNGKALTLSKEQRAYRAGYLNARKDNANAFNAKKKKGAKSE